MMLRFLYTILIFFLAFPTFNFAQYKANIDETMRSILEVRHSYIKKGVVVGAIVKGNSIEYFSIGDTTNLETLKQQFFEIGSISKVFTSLLLQTAVTNKEVSLQDEAIKYFPAGKKAPTFSNQNFTLLHLSNHTSGLVRMPGNFAPKNPMNPYADYTVEQMYQYLDTTALLYKPGLKSQYSNLGVALLGNILENKLKASIEKLWTERIFKPFGMKETFVTVPQKLVGRRSKGYAFSQEMQFWDLPSFAGAGGIKSTIVDMATFVQNSLTSNNPFIRNLIASTSVTTFEESETMDLGLGWYKRKRFPKTVLMHSGQTGGFSSFIGLDTLNSVGIVLLTNNTGIVFTDLGQYFLDTTKIVQELRPFITVADSVLSKYVGVYKLDESMNLRVTKEESGLFLQATGQEKFQLYAHNQWKFFLKVTQADVEFLENKKGIVDRLKLIQGGEYVCKKIE
ncbi:MAG: serine hydrolase [Candidatus Kapabacteria bacterium]|nr:serine hydrolase [Candidatus Kapabacteria bacterium]